MLGILGLGLARVTPVHPSTYRRRAGCSPTPGSQGGLGSSLGSWDGQHQQRGANEGSCRGPDRQLAVAPPVVNWRLNQG